MTRKEAIADLIAKVEEGDIEGAVFWRVWPDIEEHRLIFHFAVQAYYGSLDAAKALHEAVLPEWGWTVTNDGFAQLDNDSDHVGEDAEYDDVVKEARSPSGCPARAWLLAVLRALHAQQGDDA